MTQRRTKKITKHALHTVALSTHKRLQAVVEASYLLNSTLDLKKILTILVDLAIGNLNADRGTIYLIDSEKKELWSEVAKGEKKREIRLTLGEGIAGVVALDGKVVNLRDVYKDKRFQRKYDDMTGYRTKTMLCAPMRDRGGRIIGVFQILNKRKGYFTHADEKFLAALSIPASIAIENARLHEAEIENQRMEKELEVAAAIQRQLIRQTLPTIVGVELTATNIPCQAVGGDFYDIIRTDKDQLVLVIADVAGKGIPGALLVSCLQAALYSYLDVGLPLSDLAHRLNTIIYHNSTADKFITAIVCMYDLRTSKLRYVNAGHNYPIVVRKYGTPFSLKTGAICFGVLENVAYEVGECPLHPGDLLLLYTDGITETENRKGELYGEERLFSMLKRVVDDGVQEIRRKLLEDLEAFSGGVPQADDTTMVLMKLDS